MISINLYEIVFQIINFLILLWLLNRFLTKPLSEFLQNRSKKIQSDLATAEKNKKEANKILEDQHELLKQAHQEAKEVRKKAEESSKAELNASLEKAKEESTKLIENAKKDIDAEYKRTQKRLTEDAATLSIKISEKILKKNITAEDNQQLIEEITGSQQG